MRIKIIPGFAFLSLSLTAMFLVSLSGCSSRVRYPNETPSEREVVHEQTFLLWGWIGGRSYEVYDDCAQGRVYEIRVYSNVVQGFVSVATLGLFTPRTIHIVCSGQVAQYARETKPVMMTPMMPMDTEPSPQSMEKKDVPPALPEPETVGGSNVPTFQSPSPSRSSAPASPRPAPAAQPFDLH